MTTVVTIRKEIEKLKQETEVKPPKDIVVVMCFGDNDAPHGKYGYRKLHIHTCYRKVTPENPYGYEACTEKEELAILRERWEENKHTRWGKDHEKKISFEEFCKEYECNCAYHKKVT